MTGTEKGAIDTEERVTITVDRWTADAIDITVLQQDLADVCLRFAREEK